jgi:putative nucleotidyltransferase with HDIG domain
MVPLLQHADWLSGRVPNEVRERVHGLVELVGLLPHHQALGVVSADGIVLAANRPLLDMLGAEPDDVLDADWDEFMPSWAAQTGGGDGEMPATRAFDTHLQSYAGGGCRVSVVARPVFSDTAAGTLTLAAAAAAPPRFTAPSSPEPESLAAWALFITAPPTPDGVGLHRSLQLRTMIADVSALFAEGSSKTDDNAFACALRDIGMSTGVDHVSLYELAADHATVNWAMRWGGDPPEAVVGALVGNLIELPWLLAQLRTGEIVAVHSIDDLPEEAVAERRRWSELGWQSAAAVPLLHAGLLVGVLGLSTVVQRRFWQEDDLAVYRMLADLLTGLLIDRWDEHNLSCMSRCFLSFGPDVDENIRHICNAVGEIVGADTVMYNRRRGDMLETVAGWRLPPGLPRMEPSAGTACLEVIEKGGDDVYFVEGLRGTQHARTVEAAAHDLGTYAGCAVKAAGRPVASLCALFAPGVKLRPSQMELLRVLARAASVEEDRRMAVEERLLSISQVGQAMERTVATVSGAVGKRDPYTAGHERRVAELAVAIAESLGVKGERLRLLRLAATVHDLGKIVVPAEILSKPTKLSDAELAIIRRHSEAGAELLEPAQLPEVVTAAVLQHHERLDGSGYPQGIAGDDISLYARILAVADVVEAMSSHRPYRPALGLDRALEEIERGTDTLYDSEVAAVCCRLFREQGFRFSD